MRFYSANRIVYLSINVEQQSGWAEPKQTKHSEIKKNTTNLANTTETQKGKKDFLTP